MKGFNFEKNLLHQVNAVESTLSIFQDLKVHPDAVVDQHLVNPMYNKIQVVGNSVENTISPFGQYAKNIKKCQDDNLIEIKPNPKSNIIDIMMETGTGKTYTYTKTIFELNKKRGIFKFIVVVPTLSIKAGTIDFLKSESSRAHFKEQYGKTLRLHVVESQRNKSKKAMVPLAVENFVKAGKSEEKSIQVMIINAGMINSETLQKEFHSNLFLQFSIPFEAIAATKPFVIIDEPHKFGQDNKTWDNILKMKPQFILRYGATFPDKPQKQKNPLSGKMETTYVKDYHNLVYQLTAVDAFNSNLVKGIIGHITEFEGGKNAMVRFIDSDGTEASFELVEGGKRKIVAVSKKESLKKVHPEMTDLGIENLNKSTVVLSNGLEMKKGDKINPYSYAEKLQEIMIERAIKHHFKLEKELLNREARIKPITLFFIDNIEEYRSKDGYIRKTLEAYIQSEVSSLLAEIDEAKVPVENLDKHKAFKAYLEKTLVDLSATHAGYFSKDNTEKDEAIEKEINEILHDKQSMLDLENPRRFIFSKWTLREGWDNPNVFQICKLRSSGSEISKLQEVGRGLRLPVNEYGNRVKGEQFYLNYFVDFTENDFVDKLVQEINEKSGSVSVEANYDSIEPLKKIILQKYPEQFTNEKELLRFLDNKEIIERDNSFQEGGLARVKELFPLIFEGVHSNKVRKASDPKKKILVRTEKYQELQQLWEKLNEKVILEYKFENEVKFQNLFAEFLKSQKNNFAQEQINERISKIEFNSQQAFVSETESIYNRKTAAITTLKYSEFLKQLSTILSINMVSAHQAIGDAGIDINRHLNQATLRVIKQEFDHFLMANAIDRFTIEYKNVSNQIHPTKLTNGEGNVLNEISSSDIGVLFSEEEVAKSYLLEGLYYDSDLERANIKAEIEEVIVFTKIPKSSIRIPVAGGKSYSPDFAYVLKFRDGGQKLHFIVETKDVNSKDGLRDEERFKIKHAEQFFNGKLKIEFKTQFSHTKILDLIKQIHEG